MHQHGGAQTAMEPGTGKIVLLGNPNVGKSAIFGLLTGRYATVSNYPGTTVEVASGNVTLHGQRRVVLDTPGVNSLIPMSEDERVTRDILLAERPSAVVQVADAKNIRRSLLVTVQVAEMGLPLVLDLNMDDEARSRGIQVDADRLAGILGVDVVRTVAVQHKGLDQLVNATNEPASSSFVVRYDDAIEEAVQKAEALLPEAPIGRRALALMIVAGDRSLTRWLHARLPESTIQALDTLHADLQSRYRYPVSYVINQQRLKAVDTILDLVLSRVNPRGGTFAARFGDLAMHPVWGVPILLAVLVLLYLLVGQLGAGTLVDFMEEVVFGEYLNPWATRLVTAVLPVPILQDMLVGEYGLLTMALTYAIAIILPITGTFFIAFGVLEDSGYLPRLAIMLNRVFRIMGLNGKAVLPMVLGLGCDTMATMTTRILETRKARMLVTLLLALGVPCSAQLGVIVGMLGQQSAMAIGIWVGTIVAVLLGVGFLAAQVIPGEASDFVLELPPIRRPQVVNVLVKTMGRVEWYLREAVPLFLLGTFILFVLDRLTILAWMERMASPVVTGFLGLPGRATEAFLVGFLRRDYGAAGLFALQKQGLLDNNQVIVSLVTITLFVPCIANFFMIIKERGLRPALAMVAFIFPFAFLVGGALNAIFRYAHVTL